MTHDTITARRPVAPSVVARGAGVLIVALTTAVAVLLAAPGSTSDQHNDHGAQTVYPLVLLPLIVILGAAGVVVTWRPAAADVVAAISAITGVQVAGIALVAARDWLNFAGAGNASYERGTAGSALALQMCAAAAGVVAVSGVLHRYGTARHRRPAVHRGRVFAGVVVAVGVPLLLSQVWRHAAPSTAAGQFALWWSLPWGAGLVAAGTLRTTAARRAALLTVAVSVTLTLSCAAASPLFGFGLRLPD